MKKILIFILALVFISGCDWFESNNDDFMDAYKDILVAREKYKDDSVKTQDAIQKIYEKYDFTEASFREEYFDLARNKPREFYNMLDTIRERAKQEIIDIEKQNTEKQKKKAEDEKKKKDSTAKTMKKDSGKK